MLLSERGRSRGGRVGGVFAEASGGGGGSGGNDEKVNIRFRGLKEDRDPFENVTASNIPTTALSLPDLDIC